MKTKLLQGLLLCSLILVAKPLFAQTPDSALRSSDYVRPFSGNGAYRTWSIGFGAGVLTPYTVFGGNSRQDFTSPDMQLGYNAFIKDQFLPSFGIRLDYLGGKLRSDHAQPDASGISPFSQFNTQLNYAISLSGDLTLANISWHHEHGAIQPYLTFGGGFMGYKPVLTLANGSTANFKTDNSGTISEFYIPLGIGLKFDLGRGVNLNLGYQVNFVNSDNIDGYNFGSGYDRFSYAHIGLEFALGDRSKPQLATHNPVASMRHEYMSNEQALQNALQLQQNGLNAEKANNAQLRADLNTVNTNLAKLTTDSDGDGVADFYDKCPNTPAGSKVDGSGCPLPQNKPDVKVYVTEEDRKIVREAIKNLEFDFGKATIRGHSFPSLDKVAELLTAKNFSLKLAGHTDNVGSDDANLKLSKDRAESVKAYLVSKGANASRIEATGYGETQPIASNKTAKGRQLNRRVEFTLF